MTLVEVEVVSALGLPLPTSSRAVTILVFIYYTENWYQCPIHSNSNNPHLYLVEAMVIVADSNDSLIPESESPVYNNSDVTTAGEAHAHWLPRTSNASTSTQSVLSSRMCTQWTEESGIVCRLP